MGKHLSAEAIEQILVELAAQRLIMRSLLAYVAITSKEPLAELMRHLREAAEKTSPAVVALPDLDPKLHEKASALAHERAAQFVRDLGPLTSARRNGKPHGPARGKT